jgi:hypothetical protein
MLIACRTSVASLTSFILTRQLCCSIFGHCFVLFRYYYCCCFHLSMSVISSSSLIVFYVVKYIIDARN